MGVDIWPWIFPPLRGDVSACTRQWARSGRGAASRIARHGQRSGYVNGYGHGNRNGLARSRASLISSFFMVKALFCSTYSTSIVEEEPRAVFLHLFRGVVFLSFSAFSGRWFELFTVTFRRVQRFYAGGDLGRNRNYHLWVKNVYCYHIIIMICVLYTDVS